MPTKTSRGGRTFNKIISTSRKLLPLHLPFKRGRNYLLDCPAEIRNQIYRLVLTYQESLICLVDFPSFTARLITHVAANGQVNPADYGPGGRYALYEANQLKYVCRQLREETACLEIQYNSLTFPYWTSEIANFKYFFGYESFAFFYRGCRPEVRARIKKVIIYHRKEVFPGCTEEYWHSREWARQSISIGRDTFRLFYICQERPDLQILLRYNFLEDVKSGWEWVLETCSIQRALRGSSDLWLNENEDRVVQRWTDGCHVMSQMIRRERCAARIPEDDLHWPENLRIGLTFDFEERWFTEHKFWYDFDESRGWRYAHQDSVRFDMGAEEVDQRKRISQARRLFEEGV